MSKIKWAIVEKKMLRTLFFCVVIQVVIIFLFIIYIRGSFIIETKDLKQTDITVDAVDYFSAGRLSEPRLKIFSNSKKYIVFGRKTFDEYTAYEMYNSISNGDFLSIIYYESYNIFGEKENIVVDARTNYEIYRSLEGYRSSKKGLPVAVVILFSVIEVIYCVCVFIYIKLDSNTIKSIHRKIKRNLSHFYAGWKK